MRMIRHHPMSDCYIILERFSQRRSYLKLESSEGTPTSNIIALLKKSVHYYTGLFPETWPDPGHRFLAAGSINTLIDWLEAENRLYHYEFSFEQADETHDEFLSAETFEPDPEFWNYYTTEFRLHFYSEDDAAIAKLFFPDVKICRLS